MNWKAALLAVVTGGALFTAVVLAVVLGVIAPFGLIWAINTLSGAGIAYSFMNWLAAFLLIAILRGGSSGGGSK